MKTVKVKQIWNNLDGTSTQLTETVEYNDNDMLDGWTEEDAVLDVLKGYGIVPDSIEIIDA